jgi:hypothetical protein
VMAGKKKNFGRKTSVEWVFGWKKEIKTEVKKGDQVKRGDCLLKEGGDEFKSPVDGRVLRIDKDKKELVLSFEFFEFKGEAKREKRIWAEVVLGEEKNLGFDQVRGRVVVFPLISPILVAKTVALEAEGAVFFGLKEELNFEVSFPVLILKEEEREKFLSVLKLMERPVICLDPGESRLLLVENKKV